MAHTTWPLLLDMNRDECKRLLRHLELTAYEGILSAFRAQGDLDTTRKDLLLQLRHILSISTERHRAEVRRAVNDETLTTIANCMSGPDVSSEWLVEGNRLVPLMPRLVPQTAFTITANQLAAQQAEKNLSLPHPAQTANKEAMSAVNTTPVTTKVPRPTSPGDVVVLPGGRSIHIKGALALEEEEPQARKRRRSSSAESLVMPRPTTVGIPTPTLPRSQGVSQGISQAPPHTPAPMRITVSKSPQKPTTSQPQKVILVSSNTQMPPKPTVPKSSHTPVTTLTVSTPTITLPKPSIIIPSSSNTPSSHGNIITVATPTPVSTMVSASNTSYLANTLTSVKPRTKPFTPMRPRTPQVQVQSRAGSVIMGPSSMSVPQAPTMGGLQLKPPVHTAGKPAIHIKQEGSMKIITQGSPVTASKILPKPASSSVVMVSSATSNISMVSKAAASLAGKVISVGPHGSKVISGPIQRTSGANVVTVNPKTLHLASGTRILTGSPGMASGKVLSTTKPNVIVVQKSQVRRPGQPISSTTTAQLIRTPAGGSTVSFEKELVSYLQKQDLEKGRAGTVRVVTDKRKVETTKGLGTTIQQIHLPRRKEGEGGKSSLLAELIQAVGIMPHEGHQALGEGTSGGHQWVEMDAAAPKMSELPQEVADASAVQMLLNLQSAAKGRTQGPEMPAAVSRSTITRPSVITLDQESGIRKEIYQPSTVRGLATHAAHESMRTLHGDKNVIELQLGTTANLSQLNLSSRDMLREIDTPSGVVYQLVKGAIPEIDLTQCDDEPEEKEKPASEADDVQLAPPSSFELAPPSQLELAPPSSVQLASPTKVTPIPSATVVSSVATAVATESVTISSGDQSAGEEQSKPIDIFSSALAQAQIDLDKFMDEDVGTFSQKSKVQTEETAVSEQGSQQSILSTQSSSTTEDAGTTQVSLTDAESTETDSEVVTEVTEITVPEQGPATVVSYSSVPATTSSNTSPAPSFVVAQAQTPASSSLASSSSVLTIPVSKEHPPTPQVILAPPTDLAIEEPIETTTEEVGHGLGKRKRKPPTPLDESPTPGSLGGWTRTALSILQKVSKFRGANKEKNAISASAWFIRPVDRLEVPDYYEIIKNPMDLGTIKKKLENGQYAGWDEFNADMELIKDNAYKYNPPGNIVRQDCDEMLSFYRQEYARVADKWQKGQVSSPQGKKLKLDRSPSHH